MIMMYLRHLLILGAAGTAAPLMATTSAPATPAGITRVQAMQNADREFAAIDTNKDGKLSAAEIETHRRARALAALRARNARMFEQLDANKDGSLSKEEFAKLVPGEVKVDIAPLMKQADKDGDAIISAAEFRAAAAENFARRDRNGDGVVSAEEANSPLK